MKLRVISKDNLSSEELKTALHEVKEIIKNQETTDRWGVGEYDYTNTFNYQVSVKENSLSIEIKRG